MGVANKSDIEPIVLLEYRTTALVPVSAAQDWLSDGWNYIPPSQCEACVPTLTLEDDGDTAERAHQTNCPNRKDRA